ncbi:hypothetical protein [Actinomadura meridiana]|uniref:hypothetical protein n=1 Tax=Actinomadura meridiana TaxID=559626 RepID=UPI0031EF4AA4
MIDALLQEELAARPDQRPRVQRIWEQILDEHAATISYGTVRDYLAGRRPAAMR